MRRPVRRLSKPCQVLAVALTLLTPVAGAGDLTAHVSGPAPDGTLELTLETERAPLAEPNLSDLERDFDVLGRRNRHQSFMVNGRRSDSQSLILTLRPRRDGIAEIPSIQWGDETTQALPLDSATPTASAADQSAIPNLPGVEPASEPSPAASAPPLSIEAEIKPQEVRIRQQAVLTVRALAPRSVADTMARPRLYDPKIAGASVLPLGEDEYQTTRSGERNEVYERRYAIFPAQTGTLSVEPVVADVWVGGRGFAAPSQQRVSSEPLTLQVDGAPPVKDGQTWLPARSVTLTEDKAGLARIRPGETWQRYITLRVEGQPSSALPELTSATPPQISVRNGIPRLWDERQPDGIVGMRRESIVVSGSAPGLYRLPEIRLDWWNVATNKWQVAVLPARDIEIASAATSSLSPTEPARTPARVEPLPEATQTTSSSAERSQGSPWLWVVFGMVLGWAALQTWRRWRTGLKPRPAAPAKAPVPAPQPRPDPLAEAAAAVHEAYEAANADAARRALLAWAGLAWPHNPPGNLTQLAMRCPDPTRSRLILLDQAFFSPDPVDWTCDPLWEDLPAIAAAAALEPPPPPPKRRLGTPRPKPS